jgi:hypothetical protein
MSSAGRRDSRMCNQNEWIAREAFLAYDRGDVARAMDFMDPDLDRRVHACRDRSEARSLAGIG